MTFPPVEVSRLYLRSSPSREAVRREVESLVSGDARLGAVPAAGSYGPGVLCVDVAGVEDWQDVLARAPHVVRRGGLHLPVVIDDEGTSIGPLTTPGFSACLQCAAHVADRAAPTPDPAAVPYPAPAALTPLVVALVSATVALEAGRIVCDPDRLPLSLGHVVRVEHDTGAVAILAVTQVDGCEVCGSLIELALAGEL